MASTAGWGAFDDQGLTLHRGCEVPHERIYRPVLMNSSERCSEQHQPQDETGATDHDEDVRTSILGGTGQRDRSMICT